LNEEVYESLSNYNPSEVKRKRSNVISIKKTEEKEEKNDRDQKRFFFKDVDDEQ